MSDWPIKTRKDFQPPQYSGNVNSDMRYHVTPTRRVKISSHFLANPVNSSVGEIIEQELTHSGGKEVVITIFRETFGFF